jgi:hypothetical protein
MGDHVLRRAAMLAVLAGAAAASITPHGAFAAAPPKRYRCHARLEREPDHKETRTVDVVCEDGKTAGGIDGDRDYKTNPPTVMGLSCDFAVKADGDKIAVHLDATYRSTRVTIVGGLTTITASTEVTATLSPGEPSVSTMDVNGTPFTLTVTATPVA